MHLGGAVVARGDRVRHVVRVPCYVVPVCVAPVYVAPVYVVPVCVVIVTAGYDGVSTAHGLLLSRDEAGNGDRPTGVSGLRGRPGGYWPAGHCPRRGPGPRRKGRTRGDPAAGADGSALKITLGSWKKAAGTVSFSCVDNQERATSRLTGLLSGASYSVFVVHLDVQGAGRFTPWGDAEGTTNNFTADSSGTASVTNSVPGCLTNRAAAVIVWHSDGMTHGAKPGTLGVTWHNSLITALP